MVPRFGFDAAMPWRLQVTPFVNGSRMAYLDFWTLSVSQLFMAVSLHNDGTEVHVRWGMLHSFITGERSLEEFGLLNEHDPRAAAYNEVTEQILAAYPGDQLIYSRPQVVRLPFKVEATFEDELLWGPGDNILRDQFYVARLPAQMMPILRVAMVSQAKAAAKSKRKPSCATESARAWAMSPPGPPRG